MYGLFKLLKIFYIRTLNPKPPLKSSTQLKVSIPMNLRVILSPSIQKVSSLSFFLFMLRILWTGFDYKLINLFVFTSFLVWSNFKLNYPMSVSSPWKGDDIMVSSSMVTLLLLKSSGLNLISKHVLRDEGCPWLINCTT